MANTKLPHVVVVGGGFAGLAVVGELARTPVRITVVDRRVYNTFQPLLYQVATGGLNGGNVTYFLRSLRLRQKNVRAVHGRLSSVDKAAQTITLQDGTTMGYDYLVLANGVTTNFFNTPGAKEHAFPMYSRSQAMRIRDSLFRRLEEAATDASDRGLRIVIVGGGATGVEVAGALAELRDSGLRPAYPEMAHEPFDVMVIQRGDEILHTFAPPLRKYAANQLRERGVTLRLGTGVKEVKERSVILADGTELDSDLTIWSTGVRTDPEVSDWGVPLSDHGRILVGTDLIVDGEEHIFAAGDVAQTPEPLPQLAQPAIQAGRQIGRNIRRLLDGKSPKPLRYFDKGTMAIIGRRAAIMEVFSKINVTGAAAWFAWLFVHIMQLLGPRNRITTLAGLVVRYGFPFHRRPIPIVGDVPAIKPRTRE